MYERLGPDVWLFSTSGGTDLCTAFVGGVPTLPVYRGELQARALGAEDRVLVPDGTPVVGEVGELVITEPMPSMPTGLWGDESDARYRASYFEAFPGVWRHGDWIELTDRGTAIITGRSDEHIKPWRDPHGNRGDLPCRAVAGTRSWTRSSSTFRARARRDSCRCSSSSATGSLLDDELVARIRSRIRDECSPRHVPDEVRAVPAVPRTLSGKVLEVPVKRILSGEPADRTLSRDALADGCAATVRGARRLEGMEE